MKIENNLEFRRMLEELLKQVRYEQDHICLDFETYSEIKKQAFELASWIEIHKTTENLIALLRLKDK